MILISLDTVGADHMSLYGYPRRTTPFLSRLAREWVTFENASSNGGYTLPSHFSMFTGAFPTTHGIVDAGGTSVLSPKLRTLAEYLKEAGYATHWMGPVDSRWLDHRRGLARGMDFKTDPGGGRDVEQRLVTAALRKLASKKFFLFFHTYLAHTPYFPKPPHDRAFGGSSRDELRLEPGKWGDADRFLKAFDFSRAEDRARFQALYDGALLDVDERLESFIGGLKALGLYDDALIVITGDHGDEFWEHGAIFHTQLHRELLHVPLLMKLPGVAPARVSEPVLSVDIVPTVLEALGLAGGPNVDGKSLLGLARGVPLRRESYATATTMGQTAIWDRKWKLILSDAGEAQLFDLEGDPKERENVSSAHSGVVLAMRTALEALRLRRMR
ncbi:MAG: sulfatase [Deltaproteobacteria bacterium]|nr:sulfatase [Deltaproteobacteria bacterium]